MSSQIIWNTKSVNETIQKLRHGANVDLGCFFERDHELKAPNILFQLTPEEEQEFIKCSSDIEHFVETYCRFMTDKGRTLVTLRDFQRDILNTLGEEEWIESLDDFGPKVKNFLLNSSRQSGKCLFDAEITIKDTITNEIKNITLNDLYILVNKNLNKTLKQKIIIILKKIIYKMYFYLS